MHRMLQGRHKVPVTRSCIEEQGSLFSEEQIKKWLLIVSTAGLPQNEQVRVVLVHLPLRHLHALRASCVPGQGKLAHTNAPSIRLCCLCLGGDYGKKNSRNP